MRKFLKPYWLFITITIPQIIFLTIFIRLYSFINTDMTSSMHTSWVIYGSIFVAILLSVTGYAIYKQIHKRSVTKADIIIILVAYIGYLYALIYNYDMIIPFSMPDWMLFNVNPLLVIASCFMPALLYCIVAAVVLFYSKRWI